MSDYTKQVNVEIQFTDQSTNTPISWSWNFGDGTVSTLQNPKKTYTTIGTYTITLITNNACGPCTSVSKTVEIVTELPIDICTWIIGRGGWSSLSTYDIMTLVSAYLNQTTLGFTVTTAHIMGVVAYYLDNLTSGNSLTGCSFT